MLSFLAFIDELIEYEKAAGIEFDNNGFPTFSKEMFFKRPIDYIIPYNYRSIASKDSAICFYEHDKYLYRALSLEKMNIISNELQKYDCFIGFDLSVFCDFSIYVQKYIILSNLVIDMYLILKGNKLIPNLRGSSIDYYYLFNDAPIICYGTLGCTKNKETRLKTIKQITDYSNNNPNKIIITYGPLAINSKIKQINNYRRYRI
jgi:hypothetical protein